MSVDSVRAFFADNGLDYEITEFDTSTENVELAARALGVEPSLIAKTLAFRMNDGQGILVVMTGDARVDNRKFKETFNVKSRMMSHDEVIEMTGHPVGGVCPFGLQQPMDIFLDESLRQFEKVYPAAGSKNSCIEITPDEICRITGGRWVDVCK
jgi:Cys-tRNA(Pro) deacylase